MEKEPPVQAGAGVWKALPGSGGGGHLQKDAVDTRPHELYRIERLLLLFEGKLLKSYNKYIES